MTFLNTADVVPEEGGRGSDGRLCLVRAPHWLWCFTNDRNCYYMIDRSRDSPALQKFLTDEFEGVLITDFWSA